MKKQSGFTIIELMVVMAIIAILATAGLSAYTSYIKGARDSVRAQVARQVLIAIEALTTIQGPPTPARLDAYLIAEGISAWRLPTMNPIVAQLSGAIDTVFGTVFAATELDPLNGRPVCLNDANVASALCGFGYIYLPNRKTYLVIHPIELLKNKTNNFHSITIEGYTLYGNLSGTDGDILQFNSQESIEDITTILGGGPEYTFSSKIISNITNYDNAPTTTN